MTFVEAQELALRYHCKLPDYHENHPKAALWIAAIPNCRSPSGRGASVPPLGKPTV